MTESDEAQPVPVYRAWLDPDLVRLWIGFRWGFIGPERRHRPSFDTRRTVSLCAEALPEQAG
jgi:hypothetical protein